MCFIIVVCDFNEMSRDGKLHFKGTCRSRVFIYFLKVPIIDARIRKFNPLSSNSDHYQISPCNVNANQLERS